MRYSDFISEIRSLLDEGQSFFYRPDLDEDHHQHFDAHPWEDENPNERLAENPAFRRWVTRLKAAVRTMRRQGYEVDILLRDFPSPNPFDEFGDDGNTSHFFFNRDLQDTLNELGTTIHHYDNFGSPKPSPEQGTTGNPELPEQVTLSWLWEYVPAKLWITFIGLLIFTFTLGVTFSKTALYEDIEGWWKDAKNVESTK